MKRIALISDHASPHTALAGVECGGQSEYVRQVAQGLAASGCLVDVFTRRVDGAAAEVEAWSPQVRIIHVPAGPATHVPTEHLIPALPEFTRFLLDFLAREDVSYHVMHANFFTSALVAADVKRATGIPFVVTFHSLGRVRRQYQGAADRFPPERIAIEERVLREADGVVAECPQDREDLVTGYEASRAKLRLIPCGVDAERFRPVPRPRARAALAIPTDDFVLLQLGRIVPRKGIDDVIRSVGLLRSRYGIDARLLVVGGESEAPDERTTPEFARLRRMACDAQVDDLVRFVGRRCGELLRFYYSAADVFVTTPWYEPFGMTPLEAMACGTPVIGSAVGGIKYSVVDGETGFLVPSHAPDAIAERVARLHADPALRSSMGRAARARVTRAFSWFDVVRSLVALYDDVAGAQLRARLDVEASLHERFPPSPPLPPDPASSRPIA